MTAQSPPPPRGIAVIDVGYTNSKVILYDAGLNVRGERRIASPHHDGAHYRELNVAPIIAFAASALRVLDAILPVDKIVTSAHGACIVSLKADGTPAVPVMDYMSEPPPAILAAYRQVMPDFAESYSPELPMALLHGLQLFWQQQVLPGEFAQTATILPLMQYVAHALGGRAAAEVSSMSCQSHLVDMRSGGPSSLARRFGWDRFFPTPAKAWEAVGQLAANLRGDKFRGTGTLLAGVHDSNANFLRYFAAGREHFTLLSTGTWIIGFDTDADITVLDPARDIVASKNVFGKTVACCRFFGGKEFETLAKGAPGEAATPAAAARLVADGTLALPSFSDSGGPMPGTALCGRIVGPFSETPEMRATLASLYCALMVCESLDAIQSSHDIIVDGPFSQNAIFLSALAALRQGQTVLASALSDGTAAGAACLALMRNKPDGQSDGQSGGLLPRIDTKMRHVAPVKLDLGPYQRNWRSLAGAGQSQETGDA